MSDLKDAVQDDTLKSLGTMLQIQLRNGKLGCYRLIIGNCRHEFDVGRVFGMAQFMGFDDKLYFDVIPQFETIDDLKSAAGVMDMLYSTKMYMDYLEKTEGGCR